MYRELYAAWESEIAEVALQPLPADFYARVADYVRRIKEETRMFDKKSLKTSLLEQELKNVKRIIKQLTHLRYKKLDKLISEHQKLPSDFLATEEAQLAKGYRSFMDGYRTFAETLLQGHLPEINLKKTAEKQYQRVTLRFVKAIPAIIGGDMKTYGPFLPEDVASVPVENAKILVKQGLAIAVDVS